MSDIKLFRIEKTKVTELEAKSVTIEKSLQNLIESNLEEFLGVKFLATEYKTGAKHGGRIDTLGINEIITKSSFNGTQKKTFQAFRNN